MWLESLFVSLSLLHDKLVFDASVGLRCCFIDRECGEEEQQQQHESSSSNEKKVIAANAKSHAFDCKNRIGEVVKSI